MQKNKNPFGEKSCVYASGRIKALESKILKKQDYETLQSEKSYEKAFETLKKIGYANETCKDIDELIKTHMQKTYKIIDEVTPNKELTDLFLLDIDAHNLKVCLKAKLIGKPCEDLLLNGGVFNKEIIKICTKVNDYSMLSKSFEENLKDIEKIKDPQMLSTLVDKAKFSFIFEVLRKNKNSLLEEYFTKKANFININTKSRAEKLGYTSKQINSMLIDVKEENFNYKEIENLEDKLYEKLLNFIRDEKTETFTIAPVICFLLDKQNEARNLRLIFAAKKCNKKVNIVV